MGLSWRYWYLFLRVGSPFCIAVWQAGRPKRPWGNEKKGVQAVLAFIFGHPFPAAADNRSVFGGEAGYVTEPLPQQAQGHQAGFG